MKGLYKRMKKYEKVYQDIKEKIKNGELKPGDFLKKEDDLLVFQIYVVDIIFSATNKTLCQDLLS